MLNFENKIKKQGFKFVIGIDEAGRGPLAGPVVAAAVFLRQIDFTCKIGDSKKLTAIQRERAFCEIFEKADVGIGIINEKIIDTVNILEATFIAMNMAVKQLALKIEKSVKSNVFKDEICLLIDGNKFKTNLSYAYRTITRGDDLVFSISCASIVAKVIRDRILMIYDKIFPEYGFKDHKGYPTKKHKDKLRKVGRSIIHRKTFRF